MLSLWIKQNGAGICMIDTYQIRTCTNERENVFRLEKQAYSAAMQSVGMQSACTLVLMSVFMTSRK